MGAMRAAPISSALRLAMVVALVGASSLGAIRAEAGTQGFVVDSDGDAPDFLVGDGVCDDGTGACTLRAAIEEANVGDPGLVISFSIGSGAVTIFLELGLPQITNEITIDGTTQPGFGGAPVIEINGAGIFDLVDGITITGGPATVRGLAITGFSNNGISITGPGGNVIVGNHVGLDVSGTFDAGNAGYGISIEGSPNNTVGGTTASERNLISGNGLSGVAIAGSGATGNVVLGNRIGTSAGGTSDLGNDLDGVLISGAPSNAIGGTTAGAGNVISGNGSQGVEIVGSGASNNVVEGNHVGLDPAGTFAVPNSGGGIRIDSAPTNRIGGGTVTARNLVSGNDLNGIEIEGAAATGNLVQGNYVGTDITGTLDFGNGATGVIITDAPSNTVGGDTAGVSNLISGNGIGVTIRNAGSAGNVVAGNLIGTTASGTAALGNTSHGVFFDKAGATTIGGDTPAERNIISGNGGVGVGGNPTCHGGGWTIQGNYIGTDITGTADLGNVSDGVHIWCFPAATIGGTAPGTGNVISGNGGDGVRFRNQGPQIVVGNLIGTNASGTADLGNSGNGVFLEGASFAHVGGKTVAERNVISGNDGDGVRVSRIFGVAGIGNFVEGNFIGTDVTGTSSIGNSGHGVHVVDADGPTAIGGTPSGAGNTIAFNGGDGVYVGSDDTHFIRRNRAFSNGGLGIDLGVNGVTANDAGDADSGANNLQNFPVITSWSSGGGVTTIDGTLNSLANTTFALDFFAGSPCDPSLHGESPRFIGSGNATTDGAGNATFSISFAATVAGGEVVTATATDPNGNTSEISACNPIPALTLTVTSAANTGDQTPGDGVCGGASLPCTLRAALTESNAMPSRDTIAFAIGSGHQTISPTPTTALPAVTMPVVVDGTTQPGFAGTPLIELTGATLGGSSDGLRITAGSTVIRGLAINRFGGDGVEVSVAGGNVIAGNHIGTDVTGTADLGNGGNGILVLGSADNVVGGTAAGDRNVISGNDGRGVDIVGSSSTGNLVRGNRIGTDAVGTSDLGNGGDGVAVNGAPGNTVGGSTVAARNVISGNDGNGVAVVGSDATSNKLLNNYIGTNVTGTGALGNAAHGILLSQGASSNTIGGPRANTIAHNGADGVAVLSGTGNAIRRNSIHSNAGLGIDLGPDGVTPNDEGDEDSGANGLQNFPLVVGASTDPDATQVSGALSSAPDTTYRIDVFRSSACDPSGHGEAERLVGTFNVTTDESGDLIFTRSFPGSTPVGQRITATATDPAGNTSEFSPCAPVRGPQPDFNGDGFSELVVGAPEEDLGAASDAGVIHVIPGSGANLTSAGNQLWHQDSGAVADAAEAEDAFGAASAGGDFNNDGFTDLAVGIPGEDVGAATDAGAVAVLYGSASGLADASNQLWHQDSGTVTDTAEQADAFGSALVAADFNRDGYLDLAVGIPGEDVSAITDLGAVSVLYGSPTGLTDAGNQLWRQGAQTILGFAEAGDRFGSALAAGDFDADGYPDLAVGVPGEDLGPPANTIDLGAANAIYGSPAGLTGEGNQFWRQGDRGIQGLPESGDAFGDSLASGDFDGDGFADLAVGVPGEDLVAPDSGAANAIYGSATGLSGQGNQLWHQDSGTLADASEQADAFGAALASGDFNDDGISDLAVGVPGEDLALTDEGAAQVIYGSPTALSDGGNQLWHQGSPNIQDSPEAGDAFGSALASGDYDGEGSSDLVLGVPAEDVGATADAGAANALYGSATGLTDLANQLWHQDSSGILETAEAGDRFGAALG